MKIEFGVAVAYHCSGALVEDLLEARFPTFDDAYAYGIEIEQECIPSVFVILDNFYVFHCERSRVENKPYKVMSFLTHDWGMVETMVWWDKFLANPYWFVSLAVAKL